MKGSLFDLEPGQKAKVSRIKEQIGKEGLVRNLLDLGFLPGTEISVLEKYSRQEKMIVEIGLVKLAIRKIEADLLELD